MKIANANCILSKINLCNVKHAFILAILAHEKKLNIAQVAMFNNLDNYKISIAIVLAHIKM